MLIKLLQLTYPLATAFTIRTVNLEFFQRSVQPLVGYNVEVGRVTERTRIRAQLHALDAHLTKIVTTTADEMWLTQDGEADPTLRLHLLGRGLDEFTGKPALPVSCYRCNGHDACATFDSYINREHEHVHEKDEGGRISIIDP